MTDASEAQDWMLGISSKGGEVRNLRTVWIHWSGLAGRTNNSSDPKRTPNVLLKFLKAFPAPSFWRLHFSFVSGFPDKSCLTKSPVLAPCSSRVRRTILGCKKQDSNWPFCMLFHTWWLYFVFSLLILLPSSKTLTTEFKCALYYFPFFSFVTSSAQNWMNQNPCFIPVLEWIAFSWAFVNPPVCPQFYLCPSALTCAHSLPIGNLYPKFRYHSYFW